MKPNPLLGLSLVLSGGLFGCSTTAHHRIDGPPFAREGGGKIVTLVLVENWKTWH
jgi:hypothetical protein